MHKIEISKKLLNAKNERERGAITREEYWTDVSRSLKTVQQIGSLLVWACKFE